MRKSTLLSLVIIGVVIGCQQPDSERQIPDLLFADGQLMQTLTDGFQNEDLKFSVTDGGSCRRNPIFTGFLVPL